MEVTEIFLPLNEAFIVETTALPMSTLAEDGDATPLPPLQVDEPNTGIASTPSPHAEAFSAVSLLMVIWHGSLIGTTFGLLVGELHELPMKEAGAKTRALDARDVAPHTLEVKEVGAQPGAPEVGDVAPRTSKRRKLESRLDLWRWRGNLPSFSSPG